MGANFLWWLGLVACANRRQARFIFETVIERRCRRSFHFSGAFVLAAISMNALKPLSKGVCIDFEKFIPSIIPHRQQLQYCRSRASGIVAFPFNQKGHQVHASCYVGVRLRSSRLRQPIFQPCREPKFNTLSHRHSQTSGNVHFFHRNELRRIGPNVVRKGSQSCRQTVGRRDHLPHAFRTSA